MLTYLKPLRRKIGVVTLAMACVFAAGWVRSRFTQDTIRIRDGAESTHFVESVQGILVWQRNRSTAAKESALDFAWATDAFGPTDFNLFRSPHFHWYLKCCGFAYGVVPDKSEYVALLAIPYWSIVLPLTLLSAWLLLSNPRAGKSP